MMFKQYFFLDFSSKFIPKMFNKFSNLNIFTTKDNETLIILTLFIGTHLHTLMLLISTDLYTVHDHILPFYMTNCILVLGPR